MNRPKVSLQGKTKVILLCMLIATTFWFFHAMNAKHTTTISYPIEIFVTGTDKYKKANFYVSIYGNGWRLLTKKLSWGLTPIKLQKTVDSKLNIVAANHKATITDNLTGFRINYIYPDTLYID